MSMSRKDFEAIARILRENNVPNHVTSEFASYLATTNRQFNRPRFIEAATMPPVSETR